MQDLNDLYYFVQVVDHQGFAPAARALGLQKSRLSRRIAVLEGSLGARLIQRSSRQFSVTELGQAYYRHCTAMLVEAEAANAVIAEARAEPSGIVRMSCPSGLLTYRLGTLIAEFMAKNPRVEVHLESTNRHVDVIREGFDIAIRVRQSPLESTDLVIRQLGRNVHLLVASPRLLSAVAAVNGPNDLQGWTSLDFVRSDGNHAWSLQNKSDEQVIIRHRPRLVTDDIQMLHTGALNSLGAVLLPKMVVRQDIEARRLIDILPGWTSESWLMHAVFPSRRGLLPSVRALVDFMASANVEEDQTVLGR
jgi:DNA-binding transcriptional LysR family regulator